MGRLIWFFRSHLQSLPYKERVIPSHFFDLLYWKKLASNEFIHNDKWCFYREPKLENFGRITFVPWKDFYITYTQIPDTHPNLFSAPFEGCHMARYIDRRGRHFGCHIHTGKIILRLDGRFARLNEDTIEKWNEFVRGNNVSKIVVFNPNHRLYNPEYVDTWGIITSNFQCYTIYVDPKSRLLVDFRSARPLYKSIII